MAWFLLAIRFHLSATVQDWFLQDPLLWKFLTIKIYRIKNWRLCSLPQNPHIPKFQKCFLYQLSEELNKSLSLSLSLFLSLSLSLSLFLSLSNYAFLLFINWLQSKTDIFFVSFRLIITISFFAPKSFWSEFSQIYFFIPFIFLFNLINLRIYRLDFIHQCFDQLFRPFFEAIIGGANHFRFFARETKKTLVFKLSQLQNQTTLYAHWLWFSFSPQRS